MAAEKPYLILSWPERNFSVDVTLPGHRSSITVLLQCAFACYLCGLHIFPLSPQVAQWVEKLLPKDGKRQNIRDLESKGGESFQQHRF